MAWGADDGLSLGLVDQHPPTCCQARAQPPSPEDRWDPAAGTPNSPYSNTRSSRISWKNPRGREEGSCRRPIVVDRGSPEVDELAVKSCNELVFGSPDHAEPWGLFYIDGADQVVGIHIFGCSFKPDHQVVGRESPEPVLGGVCQGSVVELTSLHMHCKNSPDHFRPNAGARKVIKTTAAMTVSSHI
jgi:hypothetical protein